VSVAYKHVREEPIPPSRVDPEIPDAMDLAVLTAMAKDPALRYQSADELRADLLRFERGRPLLGGPILPATAAAAPIPFAAAGATPPPTPTPMKRPRRKRRWGAVVTVAIAFALLLALIGVLLVQSDFGKTTAAGPKADVPPVVGQQFAQAEATLTGLQFKVVRADADSDQAADQVLAQTPEAGRRVARGSAVTLTVSSATIIMPDLIGKTTQEAAAIMQAKHLTPFFTERSSDQPPGTVIETLPAAGAKVGKPPPGAANPVITVTVAQEPPVAIPDVKGQDPTAATNALNQAGFLTVTRTDTPSESVPFGQAIGTDPPAGTPTAKSAPVKLLVSTGPSAIEVPNVVGQAQDAAASQLTGLGFNVTVQQTTSTPANKGKVISQAPAAGTKLKKLDNVTITVGL